MTNSELFYFIGRCLTFEEHPGLEKEIVRMIEEDSVDWQLFVYQCSNHLILPAIYLKFRDNGILPLLPEELTEFLEEIYRLNFTRNELILEQLAHLIQLLNKQGIQPIPLKGTGNLLDGLYSDLGERMIGDIDMLVPEKDYLQAAQIMEADGYTTDGKFFGDPMDLKHYPRLAKEGVPANVEIHRLPVSAKHRLSFNPAMIDREKRSYRSNFECFLLSDQHKAIHNFIHAQLDHEGDLYATVSFRDMYDLYLMAKRTDIRLTVEVVKAKSKAKAYYVFVGKAFGLGDRFFVDNSLSTRIFCLKHELNHKSPVFYHTYRSIQYIYKRIFIGYIGKTFRAIFLAKERRYMWMRLSNRQWYVDHWNSYREFFGRR